MATDKMAESFKAGRDLGPKQLVNFYDEWVTEGTYDQILQESAGYKGPIIIASLLTKYMEDKTEKILDIGAGTGLVGQELVKEGFNNIYAVDPSQVSLDVCRMKGVYKEFINSFVGPVQLPFDDNSFASACSSGVFLTGHCDGTSLREVVRLVKPGGKIIITMRKHFYDGHHDNFDFRAVSDELVTTKVCSLIEEDVSGYCQGTMGLALIYTVL